MLPCLLWRQARRPDVQLGLLARPWQGARLGPRRLVVPQVLQSGDDVFNHSFEGISATTPKNSSASIRDDEIGISIHVVDSTFLRYFIDKGVSSAAKVVRKVCLHMFTLDSLNKVANFLEKDNV
ncbi:hypothetical protein GUJ93_ZPchr0003g17870 [Zizania palustris]|uniref:Uncharacterized protein n=1 Tax=Zizania palustris TaxID=103762 RepID=A0A8J5RM45_ZIZPA|nr:hypothetical protein GUJ93_ZPchr0003g17870 [Zizania palustris]